MIKKILFVVEGEVAEVKLLRRLIKISYPQDEYSIISYGASIYELYDEMHRDDTIDLLGLLREKEFIGESDNWAIYAVIILESIPPLRNTPIGTSEIILFLMTDLISFS